jgi:hypothetical protein
VGTVRAVTRGLVHGARRFVSFRSERAQRRATPTSERSPNCAVARAAGVLSADTAADTAASRRRTAAHRTTAGSSAARTGSAGDDDRARTGAPGVRIDGG